MNVLVLGGTGTVGRGVVFHLLQHSHNVTVYSRGKTENPFENSVEIMRGDRFDRSSFENRMQRENFDAVVDLVCFSSDDARSDLRVFGDVGHFVVVSTTAVFEGPLEDYPADETLVPNATNPYGKNKREAEELFMEAYAEEGFPVSIVRAGHIWGPGKALPRQTGLEGRWINRICHERPIVITCGGKTIATHCHARDAGAAIVGLLDRQDVQGEIFNLTGPAMTWREYHRRIGSALGREVKQVDVPTEFLLEVWPEDTLLLDTMNRWHQWHSDEKLRRTVPAFQPQERLGERVSENVEWMKKQAMLETSEADTIEDRIIEVIRDLSLEGETDFPGKSLVDRFLGR